MSHVQSRIQAPLDDVWEALIDVRTYPTWLIGARKIRRVEEGWPAPGTAFHHEVGIGGPVKIADRTRCLEIVPRQRLVLDVRALPVLHGQVTFELHEDGSETVVDMEEHPIGVYRVLAPVLAPLTKARNAASLEALEDRVRERAGIDDGA
ncbi:MAG: SRPBCC family protein [Acidimicrobiales bacterium]